MPRTSEHYLPRLPREYYQGDAVVHWTLTTWDRQQGWLDDRRHGRFRELLPHAAAREGLLCPAYVLMPDHIHLFWMGLRADTDQRNGMAFLRTHYEPELAPAKFQPQAFDHALKPSERRRDAFARTCRYIFENPVEAGLAPSGRDWPHGGAVVPGYPKLHPLDDEFWQVFWKIYASLREPQAGERNLPPIN
jgi:putative transposase